MLKQLFIEPLFFASSLRLATNGAALLAAETAPRGQRINVETLAIGTQNVCALGQRFGMYRVGLEKLGIQDGYQAATFGFRVREGFLSRTIGNARALELLTQAWRVVLPRHAALVQV